jgi:hypothetical protein
LHQLAPSSGCLRAFTSGLNKPQSPSFPAKRGSATSPAENRGDRTSSREGAGLKTYLAYKGKPVSGQLWEHVIAEDFAEFRKAGLTHPMMADIEKELGVSP